MDFVNVDAFSNDLHALPLDRSVLDRIAALAASDGIVVDVGCGPGQVSDYVDISTRMLAAAQRRGTR